MREESLRLPAGVALLGEGDLHVGARIFMPPQPLPLVLVCLAGGNMNGRYFDLLAPNGDQSYSFARAMASRRFVVVTLDYLGLGDSSKPKDGHALTPLLLTQVSVGATAEILDRLRKGLLGPALPELRSIGVGHSMGGMMSVLQQEAAHQHGALALLGFSTRGLPTFLPPEVVALSREQQRAQLVDLARRTFPQPYPVIRSSGNGSELYGSGKAELEGIAALKSATDCLLPVPAYLSMLPGNVAPEAARIDVPVFIGVGERDMTGPPEQIAGAFPASPETVLEVLPETGHSHFLFASRARLFQRLGEWAASIARG